MSFVNQEKIMDKKFDKKFYKDLTFEEWASQQDQTSLEFNAILRGHKSFPGYTLEDIKRDMYTRFIITEDNQNICMESLGGRHINPDKLNEKIVALNKILFSVSSEYKSVDKRGHGDSVSARLGGRGRDSEMVSFRIEEKAIKYAHYLIEHNMVPNIYTVSDLVRLAFAKYIEMVPIIHEFRDATTNRFLLDIRKEREIQEKLTVTNMLKGFDDNLMLLDDDLSGALRHIDNRDELEEIRDLVVNFIKDAISYNGVTKRENNRVKDYIMRNPTLYNILTTLEREKLVTREYIDTLRQKGIVPPSFDILPGSETNI